jgi:hypothetical protein
MARVTSIAYETRNGPPHLALKTPQLTLKELADLCVQYLAQNPEQLAEFMVQSGLTPGDLRGLMGTERFAHGLVDYVVSNEPLLMAVAADASVSPDVIMRTWAKLHATEH